MNWCQNSFTFQKPIQDEKAKHIPINEKMNVDNAKQFFEWCQNKRYLFEIIINDSDLLDMNLDFKISYELLNWFIVRYNK